jgi:hypothetical protein
MRAQGKSGVYWTHHNGTQIVEIERDIAKFEHTPSPSAVCVPREPVLRAGYLDRVEKQDGVWKIAHRRVVYSPCHIVQIEEEFFFYPCPLNVCMTQDFQRMKSISGKKLQNKDRDDRAMGRLGSQGKQIRQLCG